MMPSGRKAKSDIAGEELGAQPGLSIDTQLAAAGHNETTDLDSASKAGRKQARKPVTKSAPRQVGARCSGI